MAAMVDEVNFISQKYPDLRKSEMKVADYVLKKAEDVIHFSVSQLAEQARVSDPTVIRFCRALGFKGFQDFKIHLARNVIPPVRTIHESMNEREEAPELVRKVFAANQEAIQSTLGTLDFAVVQNAIEDLRRAEKIIFHGLAGSAAVAMDAHHKFFRIGIPCEWYSDPHMAIMAAAMMKPGQVFVAISHSGSTHDVIESVQAAKGAGATTIGIVSYGKSPLSKVVKHTLLVGSSETGFRFEPMASRIAQLCVIDVLSVGVSLLRSDEVLSNLTKSRDAIANKRY
ncbi:MurR/RpiR family transcriptional regulator [Propionivibrio sp.]|uniref:MurR/RpiR family transcriptional regulator n=1 Tax=Propionivibrio sp. TaxID=2212460 RepID=UPI0039E335B8